MDTPSHLWLKILIGMGLGIALGFVLSPEGMSILPADQAMTLGAWIKLPGTLFLSLIQMVIIPLIVCSITLGIADAGSMAQVKSLSIKIVPYFLCTTAISIAIGLAFVQLIKPGLAIDASFVNAHMSPQGGEAMHTFSDLTIPQRLANLIPTNPAKAELDRNMLQIVVASIILGAALLNLPKAGKAFRDLCVSGQALSMKIVSWAMHIAPYAAFGLLCNITIQTGLSALSSVGLYMACVLLGLASMMMAYALIARFIGGMPLPFFLRGVREAQLIAFSTSSSAATMPISIKCAEENLKIKPQISRFVVPLGATINMDGTALYQAVAAVFLCQVFQIDLSVSEILLLLITTVGASIGTPATPGVGIVVLATILVSLGVPAEGIALIVGVDRILDMCRTCVNVTGDLTASVVMNKLR